MILLLGPPVAARMTSSHDDLLSVEGLVTTLLDAVGSSPGAHFTRRDPVYLVHVRH